MRNENIIHIFCILHEHLIYKVSSLCVISLNPVNQNQTLNVKKGEIQSTKTKQKIIN